MNQTTAFLFLNQLWDTGTMSSLRASYNMLSGGLPSNFAQNPMQGIFSSAGIRNFGTLDGSGQLPTSTNLHSVLGSSGIPGLAATSGVHNDMRSFDQRRRDQFFAAGMHDHVVKREEVHQQIDKMQGISFVIQQQRVYLLYSSHYYFLGHPGLSFGNQACASDSSHAPITSKFLIGLSKQKGLQV